MAGKDKTIKKGLTTVLIMARKKPAIMVSANLFWVVIEELKKPAAIQSPRAQTIQRVKKRCN